MTRNLVTVSAFTPTLFICPLAANKDECEKAIGRFVGGVIQHYEMKPNQQGTGNNHFYSLLVESTNVPEAQVFTPGEGGKGVYVPVPVTLPELYTVRAPALLHYLLAKFWTDERFRGCYVQFTYQGLKAYTNDKGQKVNSHQFSLQQDADFTPALAGPQAASNQLEHTSGYVQTVGLAAPVEEALPPFDENA